MTNKAIAKFAKVMEDTESEIGVEALGDLLAKCLCAVTARVSNQNIKVWPVSTGFVEGEVHVVFGPGDELLNKKQT